MPAPAATAAPAACRSGWAVPWRSSPALAPGESAEKGRHPWNAVQVQDAAGVPQVRLQCGREPGVAQHAQRAAVALGRGGRAGGGGTPAELTATPSSSVAF